MSTMILREPFKSTLNINFRNKHYLLLSLLFVTCLFPTQCIGGSVYMPLPDPEPIICIIGSPPEFVAGNYTFTEDELLTPDELGARATGLGVDLARSVFEQILNWNVTYRYVNGFADVLYATRIVNGCNVAVSSIFQAGSRDTCDSSCVLAPADLVVTNTEVYESYACCIDFSDTYYTGGWALMSKQRDGTNLNWLNVFFQVSVVNAIAVTVVCAFGVSFIAYFLERKTNLGDTVYPPHMLFRYKFLDGLRNSIWFSSSSVLGDVGSSNMVPLTVGGRVLFTLWVMFGVFVLSYITSLISSTLTDAKLQADEITTMEDASGLRFCVIMGFYSEFLTATWPDIPMKLIFRNSNDECYAALKADEVDVIFGVREQMVYYFSEGNGAGLIISPIVRAQDYSIVWTDEWEYGSVINEAIQAFKEEQFPTVPTYNVMTARWYYGDSSSSTSGGTQSVSGPAVNWIFLGSALGLVGVYLILQVFVMLVHRFLLDDDAISFGSGSQHGLVSGLADSAGGNPDDAMRGGHGGSKNDSKNGNKNENKDDSKASVKEGISQNGKRLNGQSKYGSKSLAVRVATSLSAAPSLALATATDEPTYNANAFPVDPLLTVSNHPAADAMDAIYQTIQDLRQEVEGLRSAAARSLELRSKLALGGEEEKDFAINGHVHGGPNRTPTPTPTPLIKTLLSSPTVTQSFATPVTPFSLESIEHPFPT